MMNGVAYNSSPGQKIVPPKVVGMVGCKSDSATDLVLGPQFPSNTITPKLAV